MSNLKNNTENQTASQLSENHLVAIEAVQFLLDQGNPEEYDERLEDMFEACINNEVLRQGHKLPEIYYLRNMLHDFFASINSLRHQHINQIFNRNN